MVSIDQRLQQFFKWCKTPVVRRIALMMAAGLFLVGFYVSYQQVSPALDSVSWWPVALVAFLIVPCLIALNGAEVMYAARLVGVDLPFLLSLKISVQASAANLLPLPAGPMLRAAAVMDGGGTAGQSGVAVLLPAFLWLGLGLVISGGAAWSVGGTSYALLFGAAGIMLMMLSAFFVGQRRFDWRSFKALLVVKFISAALDVAALYFLFLAIGSAVLPNQAAMLAASAPLGAAVAVVPSGLGVREIASSALGVLAGISAASGFLVPSLLRFIFLGVLLPISLVFAAGRGGAKS